MEKLKISSPYICEAKNNGKKFYPALINYVDREVAELVGENMVDYYSFDEVIFFKNKEFIDLTTTENKFIV